MRKRVMRRCNALWLIHISQAIAYAVTACLWIKNRRTIGLRKQPIKAMKPQNMNLNIGINTSEKCWVR